MAPGYLHAVAAAYLWLIALLGFDCSARTVVHLPGAFEAPMSDGPVAIYVSYVWGPMYIIGLLAVGLIDKLTSATFSTIDRVLDSTSNILRFLSPKLSFTWRFSWDTRTAINRLLDDIHAAIKVFIDVSPYAVLVAPIADPCTQGFRKAKAFRWTAWVTQLVEGVFNFACGLFVAPSVHIAKVMYNMYMDTVAAITSFNISLWVAANTLPLYFLWATYEHGLRGAIGLTAAHGISFAPSPVASTLHRTAGTFLGGIGIDYPNLTLDTTAGKPNNSSAVNLTASSTVAPP